MIHLVTYASENMTESRRICAGSALRYGVHEVHEWGDTDILMNDYTFFCVNNNILTQSRGVGYWLWKPYCIMLQMLDCNDGDILIYSDAGVEFINSVNHIINRMDEDIFFFTNGHQNVKWCKMDVLNTILPEWDSNDKQVQASVIFFKVNQKTRDFVKEWLLWCQMPGFIDDSPSKIPNYYDGFVEHRHDQAILTCLQIKYGYKLHWWPTQYSAHIRIEGDDYPIIFNHHRLRNSEYKLNALESNS
jgi:hypothetical protein